MNSPAEEIPLEISNDSSRLDVDLIYEFLSKSYWAAGRSRAAVEKSIRHSLCFGAYIGREQVGFARVITDEATFAYLADVFVVSKWRGRGISKRLIKEIVHDARLSDVSIMLKTRDAHGLYEQFGFEPSRDPERFMTLVKRH